MVFQSELTKKLQDVSRRLEETSSKLQYIIFKKVLWWIIHETFVPTMLESRVSDPDPDSIGSVDPDPYPDPESKNYPPKEEKSEKFMFWSAGFFLRADLIFFQL